MQKIIFSFWLFLFLPCAFATNQMSNNFLILDLNLNYDHASVLKSNLSIKKDDFSWQMAGQVNQKEKDILVLVKLEKIKLNKVKTRFLIVETNQNNRQVFDMRKELTLNNKKCFYAKKSKNELVVCGLLEEQ